MKLEGRVNALERSRPSLPCIVYVTEMPEEGAGKARPFLFSIAGAPGREPFSMRQPPGETDERFWIRARKEVAEWAGYAKVMLMHDDAQKL